MRVQTKSINLVWQLVYDKNNFKFKTVKKKAMEEKLLPFHRTVIKINCLEIIKKKDDLLIISYFMK